MGRYSALGHEIVHIPNQKSVQGWWWDMVGGAGADPGGLGPP